MKNEISHRDSARATAHGSAVSLFTHVVRVVVLAGILPLQVAAAQDGSHTLDGVWQSTNATSLRGGRVINGMAEPMAPVDGGPIPFQPWNAALHAGWVNAIRSNKEWTSNNQRCLVAGTLRAMKGNFPWRLIETHDQVTFLFEEDNRVNIARFREQHAADVKPTWTGDSIARWQGDTLVIDTVAFNGKTPFPHGVFITTQLHLIHHFRLVAQGTQLEDRIKIDDPGAFTKSFEIVSTFNRVPGDYKLADYRCAENNQDMPENMPFWPVEWGPE